MNKNTKFGIFKPSRSGALVEALPIGLILSLTKNTWKQKSGKNNYLRILLKADQGNAAALGSFVHIQYGNKQQVHEATPYRGYLSTMEPFIHFGIGADSMVSEVKVTWPDGKEQVLKNIKTNQAITITEQKDLPAKKKEDVTPMPLFNDVTNETGVKYIQSEKDYIDFNIQKLLPHKFSQYGPAIATGDINGDRLDDFFISGSYGNSGSFFIQKNNGKF